MAAIRFKCLAVAGSVLDGTPKIVLVLRAQHQGASPPLGIDAAQGLRTASTHGFLAQHLHAPTTSTSCQDGTVVHHTV